jgi:hypothetical protein
VNIKLEEKEVNQVKAVSDKDKENILNFNVSLALASQHCKINWSTCSNVVLSPPIKLRILRNSIASKVRVLVIVIGV